MTQASAQVVDDDVGLDTRFRRQIRVRLTVLALATLAVVAGLGELGSHLTTPHPLSAYQRASAGIFDSPLAPIGPLQRVRLGVRGLVCVCGEDLVARLQRVPGIYRLRVHFDTRDALVDFDPQVLPLPALLRAFTTAGFPVQAWTEPQLVASAQLTLSQ